MYTSIGRWHLLPNIYIYSCNKRIDLCYEKTEAGMNLVKLIIHEILTVQCKSMNTI